MAIYHFSVSVIKRSEIRSVVAAAAWQRGIHLLDERLGRTHDFSKRGPGAWSDVLLPHGADPSWRDPAVLWNAIEARERRADSQLARRIQLALPTELSAEQNLGLTRSFLRKTLVGDGMITDVTVRLTKEDGSAHPFAVVLASMRSVIHIGDVPSFGDKVKVWNDRRTLTRWRQDWCVEVNAALERAGHSAQVDHRSMAAQELSLEPQITVGVVAKRRQERGLYSERVIENEEIRTRRSPTAARASSTGDRR